MTTMHNEPRNHRHKAERSISRRVVRTDRLW
jgi:hypothetical protein